MYANLNYKKSNLQSNALPNTFITFFDHRARSKLKEKTFFSVIKGCFSYSNAFFFSVFEIVFYNLHKVQDWCAAYYFLQGIVKTRLNVKFVSRKIA